MNKIVFLSLGVMVWLLIGCAPVESTPVAMPTSTHADEPAVARQIQPTPTPEIEIFEEDEAVFQWFLKQKQHGHPLQSVVKFLSAHSEITLSVVREIPIDGFDEPLWHICGPRLLAWTESRPIYLRPLFYRGTSGIPIF